jgi:hypothetical protein
MENVEKSFEKKYINIENREEYNVICNYFSFKKFSKYFKKKNEMVKDMKKNFLSILTNEFSNEIVSPPPGNNVNLENCKFEKGIMKSRPRPCSSKNINRKSSITSKCEEDFFNFSDETKKQRNLLSSIHPTLLPYHASEFTLPNDWVPQMDRTGFIFSEKI